jgi:hypothetical protein
MELECPHCFTFVHVQDAGQCPACHENTNDLRGLDRDLATVVIGENSSIPDVCCCCGITAQRSIRIQQSKRITENSSAMTDDAEAGAFILAFHAIFGWIGGVLLASLLKRSSHNRHTVCVPITQCEECSTAGPPQPLRVDYEYFSMRFVVHRNFRNCFDELVRESSGWIE